MYRAGCLLREGELGIAGIARAVGYESAGAFNRVFQRVHGQTPGEFRRRMVDGEEKDTRASARGQQARNR